MRRIIFLVVIIAWCFCPCASAQYNPDIIDSLQRRMPHTAGKDRLAVLVELCFTSRDTNPDECICYGREVLALAAKLNTTAHTARALNVIGFAYGEKGDLITALDYAQQSAKVAEMTNDPERMAFAYYNMASINLRQGNFNRAQIYLNRAIDIFKNLKHENGLAYCQAIFAEYHMQMGQYDLAEKDYQLVLQIRRKTHDMYRESGALNFLADVRLKQGCYREALTDYYVAQARYIRYGNWRALSVATHQIAQCQYHLTQYDSAIDYSERSIRLARQLGLMPPVLANYELLHQIYAVRKDFVRAYTKQNLATQLKDSLINQRGNERFQELQEKFINVEQRFKLEQLEAENRFRSRLIGMGSGASMLGLLLLGLLLRKNARIKKTNQLLKIQQEAIQASNAALQKANAELLQVNNTKDKLFSIISHDLRGPIGSLVTVVSLLANGSLSQQDFLDLSTQIQSEVNDVYHTLDDLLAWALTQMRGIQPHAQLTDLTSMVDQQAALFIEMTRKKQIRLVSHLVGPCLAYADTNHVQLILRNLLGNALKFTPTNGQITIDVVDRGHELAVSVTDTGTGMSPQNLATLFTSLHQSQPGTDGERGTGLGLLLTKEMVEKNGGVLSVQSILGQGSVFTFSLPKNPPTEGANQAASLATLAN